MLNLGCITKEDIKKHNANWPEIPDHPYWKLITGASGSGKNKCVTKSNKSLTDIDKFIYMLKTHLRKNINC